MLWAATLVCGMSDPGTSLHEDHQISDWVALRPHIDPKPLPLMRTLCWNIIAECYSCKTLVSVGQTSSLVSQPELIDLHRDRSLR